jgi:SPP1 gp7 family putative phage head morphogenesis protein
MWTIEKAILEIIEALGKPGVMSPAGQKREKTCAQDVERYFAALKDAIAESDIATVALIDHREAALHVADARIENILRRLQPLLLQTLSTNIYLAMIEGEKVARRHNLKEAAQPAAVPVLFGTDTIGAIAQRAANYAAKRAATQVVDINRTTLKLMRDAIRRGIEDQLGTVGLGNLLQDEVLEMSTYRSQMIATTEMNDAFSQAALEKITANGYEWKRWITSPLACDECVDVDEEVVAADDIFSIGVSRPPAHPNCRCAIVPSFAPDDERNQ